MPRKHNFHLHLPDWSVDKLPSSGTEEKLPLEVQHPIEEPIPLKSGDIEKVVSDSPSLEKVTSPQGVFSFLYPTHAHLHIHSLKFDWYSRDHRKGRHPVEHGKRRPITVLLRLEYWNISWWVAFLFTLGSAIWVVNGFFSFLPSVYSNIPVYGYWLGYTGLAGGTVFEIGAYMMVLESLNRKQVLCFGNACKSLYRQCTHHFHNSTKPTKGDESEAQQEWVWWGARWTEIGFLASLTQIFAASVFWIATITGIPGCINMNNIALTNGIFWVPQVIGGTGFTIASLLFMLETQGTWYNIRPLSLGWNCGFWNLVGSIGFTICGIFGILDANAWAAYQSGLATFWGSWAFLLGSVCQWIEALNR